MVLRNRFEKKIDKKVEQFVASIPFDYRLYKEDIAGSIAHTEMLARQNIIPNDDSNLIISGLRAIQKEIEKGTLKFNVGLEDIHMNIESRLFEKIGEVAAKLHTARSRNDQISLDMRLYLKRTIPETLQRIAGLEKAIINLAEINISVIMPGFTHLQHAQPVLFSHYMLAYFEMLQRDSGRLQNCLKSADVMPLGSGALAGVNYQIDRLFVARKLGFAQISKNSMDAVSDRDFVLDYEASAAIAMMHLSRLAEEFILWSSTEFNFIEVDESYCTSSSIMPQKKNPDVLELIRGKTGRVYGSLINMLTVLKSLPLAYNRDLQEDKEPLFNTIDTLNDCLEMMTNVISTIKINDKKMYQAASQNYILATDVADYLVKQGLPFRKAHTVVAGLVKYAISKGKNLNELALSEYQNFSPLFKKDVFQITPEKSIAARDNIGSTSTKQVKKVITSAKKILYASEKK